MLFCWATVFYAFQNVPTEAPRKWESACRPLPVTAEKEWSSCLVRSVDQYFMYGLRKSDERYAGCTCGGSSQLLMEAKNLPWLHKTWWRFWVHSLVQWKPVGVSRKWMKFLCPFQICCFPSAISLKGDTYQVRNKPYLWEVYVWKICKQSKHTPR